MLVLVGYSLSTLQMRFAQPYIVRRQSARRRCDYDDIVTLVG